MAINTEQYNSILQDMVDNPVKYYQAFNGSTTKYYQQLNYLDYMNQVSNLRLPENATKYANLYGDMNFRSSEYIEAYGSRSAYDNALQQVKELYGIEKSNYSSTVSLVSDRVDYSFLQETGLDQYYTYDSSNEEDAILSELGYAPSSFDYTQEDISNIYNSGYKVSDYDAQYIVGNLYTYDTSDPDDLLNQALGLMPKSFKYSNSVEDQIREANGELPEEAEAYETTTQQYVDDYSEYLTAKQEYIDELYAYGNLPKSSQLVTDKPVDPYENEDDIPDTIKAILQYKQALAEQQDLIDSGVAVEEGSLSEYLGEGVVLDEIAAPPFAYDDTAAYTNDEFTVSSSIQELVDKYEAKIAGMSKSEVIQYAKENGFETNNKLFNLDLAGNYLKAKGYIADLVYEEMYTDYLKETGEYDTLVAAQDQLNLDIEAALNGEYSAENLTLLKNNIDLTTLGIEGETGLNQITIRALLSAGDEGISLSDNVSINYDALIGGKSEKDTYIKQVASDPVIQDINAQLEALGWNAKWNGMVKDATPEIQELIDQATYRTLQLQVQNVEDYRSLLSEQSSFKIAVDSGVYTGVNRFFNNMDSLNKHILHFFSYPGGNNVKIEEQIADLAEKSAAQTEIGSINTAQGKNASNVTQFAYETTASATEMVIELALGGVVGKAVGIGASATSIASEATATTAATSVWKTVGKRLIMNKNLIPFFASSLGRNLIEGEQAGRSYTERWLAALPAAYTESVIEQQFGLFSGHSSMNTLIEQGVKGMTKQTLTNVGKMLLENTLGEAIEEVLQDYTTEFWRDVMYKDYKGNYPTTQQIGKTALMAGTIGLIFSMFGLGANISNVMTSKNAEASFNNAVAAYENGDIETFNSEMSKFKSYMEEAKGDLYSAMDNGSFDEYISTLEQSGVIDSNLNNMQDAIQASYEAQDAYANGRITAEQAALIDARANEAINRVATNINATEAQPNTLYEQVSTSEELTQIYIDNGYAAELIKMNNNEMLTDSQIQVLREVQAAAQNNLYVNVKFDENTTVDMIQSEVAKTQQAATTRLAELNNLTDTVTAQLKQAYSKSTKEGQTLYNQMQEDGTFDSITKLNKQYNNLQSKLIESTKKLNGYNTQQQLKQKFTQAAQDTSPITVSNTTVGQTVGAAANVAENGAEAVGGRLAAEVSVDEIVATPESLSQQAEKVQTTDDGKIANVLTSVKQATTSLKDKIATAYDFSRRQIVDTGATIDTFAKKVGDTLLYPLYNNAKQGSFTAQYMIGGEQFDINGNRTGDSLIDTFKSIKAQGEQYTSDFYSYLLHRHNIYRMAQDKPVFGESVTAEDSTSKVQEYETTNPEFAAYAEKVYAYNNNLMQWRVDSGLVSQEQADTMLQMYPYYVPTYRSQASTSGSIAYGNTVTISNTVKKAIGSNLDIMPIDESMARQTMQVIKAAKRNILGLRLFNDVIENGATANQYVSAVDVTASVFDIDAEFDMADLKNTVKIYKDGEVATLKVNTGIFKGFEAISYSESEYNVILKAAEKFNSTFKKLITGYNPVFTVRNFFRDLQDAGLYTKYPGKFVKNFPIAYKEIITNGEYWQMYQRLGGTGSSFFDYNHGIKTESTGIKKVATFIPNVIEAANMAIEQAPRLAEFISTIESGGMSYENMMQAVYNSAEVTVNFGRSGSFGKVLNSTFVPFFNPSVQGASRLIRRFTETKGVAGWSSLVIRAVALGVVPSLINSLIYADDDEYKYISNRNKDRYYLFKMGDGYWAKIPKGRVLSLFGAVTQRAVGATDTDFAEFIDLAGEQVAPVSPLESNILSPLISAANNKTWYGTDIESDYLAENYAPGQRYDESTDAFSKWLGGALNWSPKKINYVIDQYSGVIGDFLLPATTAKAEKDPFTSAFVIDTVTTNRLSTDFYEIKEDITQKSNSTDATVAAKAKAQKTIINRYASDISDLNALIREVQNSDMTDKEKYEKVRDLKAYIGAMQQEALDKLQTD